MAEQALLKEMNDLLATGLKVYEVEKQLGYSEGTARRRLSDAGYKYSRKEKIYIPKEESKPQAKKTISNAIADPPTITGSNAVIPRQKQELQQEQPQTFSRDHVDILHKMIAEYKLKEKIQASANEDMGKTINRNIRVYEQQYDMFSNWCKEQNITQALGLHTAIKMLMDSVNK